MAGELTVQVDQRSLERARKIVDRYRDRGLAERLRRGTLQAARLLVGPIRSDAPIGPTRNLRNSVRAYTKTSRLYGKTMGAGVGPMAPHRHLVIQPHRIVTPGGTDTGRRTSGNPFVDAAVAPRKDQAVSAVAALLRGDAVTSSDE